MRLFARSSGASTPTRGSVDDVVNAERRHGPNGPKLDFKCQLVSASAYELDLADGEYLGPATFSFCRVAEGIL
jgi:hypothetical protein